MQAQLQQLKDILAEVDDLMRAAAVLQWDLETYMPPGGVEARSQQLATLERLAHTRFVSEEVGRLLEDLHPLLEQEEPDSNTACLLRVTQSEYEKECKLPGELVAELARKTALAHTIWQNARETKTFSTFQPLLNELVDLMRRKAENLGYTDHIYDPLLDVYEPQMKTAEVAAIFKTLKDALVPLIQQIAERRDVVQDKVFQGHFDVKRQWDFSLEVLREIGYDFRCGRQDASAHPFTTSFSPDDVRITTRVASEHFSAGLFGSIHEGGHALYEQGIPREFVRTPLNNGASSAIHESQSRFWENVVGRSRPFWTHFLPRLQRFYPEQLANATVDQVYQAVNVVQPSFIRVEADEVTYNLHVFLRFELETDLLAGAIEVKDLPELWNQKMNIYLGITPPDDALGVLQDVHWSAGLFGYFPTYALGNVLALQFEQRMRQDWPGWDTEVAQGKFAPILHWQREHIHAHGRKFAPQELVQRVTGETINPQPYIAYLEAKYGELYGL
ncbi:carboxypeptidase Taq [Candidatus Vecturithrix granuli]|uniref:Metal-dependent carboxypeptidase n=1 Tax=Vecturithrix granuli TaxID=1499967 RepID=A0A081BZR3_VECG1|nr:carboxypeptidase Taq [Candidatus Vecturithrix granuli]